MSGLTSNLVFYGSDHLYSAAIDDDTGFDAQKFAASYVDLRSGTHHVEL